MRWYVATNKFYNKKENNMDKEKVKMLQESLEYFQQMQEDDTLMEIIFKTSDGKLHGIGTPTTLKLLLEVAVIELERQLHSARFGDAPEQLTMCREYKTAMELERRLNDYSFDTNRFAESIPYMHRTLQQTFFRLVKASILHMAQQKPASIDGRNKASYEIAGGRPPCLRTVPFLLCSLPCSWSGKHVTEKLMYDACIWKANYGYDKSNKRQAP